MKTRILLLLLATVTAGAQTKFAKQLSKGNGQVFVVYGTSVESLGHGRQWVEAVGKELDRLYEGDLVLYNSGRSGMNSRWALQHLQDSVIARCPDAVLVEFATNDAIQRFNISLEECRNNTLEIIRRIQEALPKCEIILQTTCGHPLGKAAESRPDMSSYNNVYAEIAKEKKLLHIDESEIFADLFTRVDLKTYRTYSGDGVHSTSKGAMEIFFPVVMEALTGKRYQLDL